MKKSSRIILDIVPLTRIPLSRSQSFSYLSDKKSGVGALVSIPLFRRKTEGIVIGNRPDFARLGNIELKNIGNIIEEDFLDANQLELAKFISDYYISPLGIVLKSFVPKRVKARRNLQPTTYNLQPKGKIILTKEQQKAVNEIAERTISYKLQAESYYLFGPAGSGKTEVYIKTIAKLKEQDPELQFLILLPELTLTQQAIERYGQHFDGKEIAVLHSKVPKGKFYAEWQKIRSGEAKIIIGSRMSVFAPFKKLGLIVVDEEQDISFKQWDMNPRYDARTVAEKLASIHHSKIVFGSATPSIEYFYRASEGKIRLIRLPNLKLPGNPELKLPEVMIVDLKKERWQKNYSPISKKLGSEIAYALKHGNQAILFINRQGMSNFSICADCRTVLRCPKCERALIYDSAGHYRCVHCSYKTSITPRCAKCKGLRFQNIGLGTQKIEREIMDVFPAAKIARVDNQTMKAPSAQEKIYADFSSGKIDILIGTQMISKGWDLPNVALSAVIDADNLFSVPDFSGRIRAYQHIVQISGRTGRPDAKQRGAVLIQTFNPESETMKIAAERNFEKLYALEAKERQYLGFPPFGRLVKLVYQDYNLKKTDTEAGRIYLRLKNIYPVRSNPDLDRDADAQAHRTSNGVKISEPQAAFVSRIRGRFRRQIILKISPKKEIPSAVRKILESLPTGWIIDVDPLSVI
jgi:primosomal protein N' (replication factor Y)